MAETHEYWKEVRFKGQQVHARCTPDGSLLVERGLVPIRYSLSGGKIYSGSLQNVEENPNGPAPILREADGAPKAAPSKKSNPKQPPLPRPGAIVAYTDGACSGNPGPAGYGVLIEDGTGTTEISGFLGEGTNNIAELSAIGSALEAQADVHAALDLYTDSSYAIGVLTKGWKAKANQELIASIRRRLAHHTDVLFHWVKGHAGFEGNERADELARLAVERQESAQTHTPAVAQDPQETP